MSKEKDKFEKELEIVKHNLQDCQVNLKISSCLNCEKIFDCEIRKTYITAVYNSMSKGQSGGFEF